MNTKTTLATKPARPAHEARDALRALDDSALAQRFLEGERRAFGILVDRYDGRLVNFVYRTIGDRERAQDLVQETFIRVYRHLHRFDPTRKFSTWIYTIASNLAKNELRNRSRNPLVFFQTIKKNWEADHRPLEWETTPTSPTTCTANGTSRRSSSGPSASCRSTIGWCSYFGNSTGEPTRRSPKSPASTWAP